MELTKKQSPVIFYVYYFVIFLGMGIQGSFMNLYLNNAGMQQGTISSINGLTSVLSFFTMMLWGRWADRAGSRNQVLIVSSVASIAVLFGFYYTKQVWLLALLMITYTAVHNPMGAIYETITMDYCTRNDWRYSPIRMSGTIGYAFMAVVAGFWISKHPDLMFPIYIGTMVLATACALMLPKSRSPRLAAQNVKKKGDAKLVFAMLKDKQLLRVMILFMMYMMSNSFNGVHFSIYLKQFTTVERAILLSGVSHMVMALAEIPFHVGPGSRWLKKIGVEKSLCIVMAVGTVRWLCCAFCPNEWVLVGTMAFNGIMLVPTIVGVVEFIYSRSPEHLKATAQSTLRTPFNISAMLLANFGFGTLASVLTKNGLPGVRIVYAILAPICLVAGLAVAIPMLKREKAEKLAAQSAVNE